MAAEPGSLTSYCEICWQDTTEQGLEDNGIMIMIMQCDIEYNSEIVYILWGS